LIEALPNLGILAVLLVGAWRVDQGFLSPGTLVTFAYLFRLVALPMRVFGWLLGELPRSVVGLHRVQAVLSAEERVSYGSAAPPTQGGAGAVVESIA
jgi:ABC-type multidrug transport system fused ATPase/permease subunit